MTFLFPLLFVSCEFYRFLHRGKAKYFIVRMLDVLAKLNLSQFRGHVGGKELGCILISAASVLLCRNSILGSLIIAEYVTRVCGWHMIQKGHIFTNSGPEFDGAN